MAEEYVQTINFNKEIEKHKHCIYSVRFSGTIDYSESKYTGSLVVGKVRFLP